MTTADVEQYSQDWGARRLLQLCTSVVEACAREKAAWCAVGVRVDGGTVGGACAVGRAREVGEVVGR